ncbi:energy transducer TonB [Mucilaginibacter hurinus]|uniref:Energy transducer TonB n=1 Tax=Mucilaginibacter hurinus TaxID=2201324 RepID=A0A367GNI4_9SPHI|nr:energy transducer TonB [Mucilaginibacter hurinus]RCH54585.1 energy transducer TonB [Mucilaginibacter hurinus]
MLGSRLDLLKQEWIDVVFSDRNKAYGAYELRQQNSKRTGFALLIGISLFVFVIALPTIINAVKGIIPKEKEKVKITDVILTPPPPVDQTKKPPPPVPEPPKPKVDQVKFPPPVVKPDDEVKDEEPPTVKELEVADPGQETRKGDPNAEIRIDEPVGDADVKQVIEGDPNEIFNAVEQPPAFPGGLAAFGNYLSKNIRYPAVARENNVQGRVFLQFVVEKDGSLTDIKVLRSLGSGTDEEAIRVLKKSPRWTPGVQNGRNVRVLFTVPIAFNLASE